MYGVTQGSGTQAIAATAEAVDIYALLASRTPELYAGEFRRARDALINVTQATDRHS